MVNMEFPINGNFWELGNLLEFRWRFPIPKGIRDWELHLPCIWEPVGTRRLKWT